MILSVPIDLSDVVVYNACDTVLMHHTYKPITYIQRLISYIITNVYNNVSEIYITIY